MEKGRKIDAFIKRHRSFMLAAATVLYGIFILEILPIKESLTPQITQMNGKLYIGEEIANLGSGFIFYGKNLDDVDRVYIDGEKEDVCQIISSSPDTLVVHIPEEIYKGKEYFEIQVSKNFGGIFPFKGREYLVQAEEYTESKPEICGASKNTIPRRQGWQKIILNVKNWVEGTHLYINEEDVGEVQCFNNDSVEIALDPNRYSDRDSVEFKLGLDINPTQRVHGNTWKVDVEDIDYSQMDCSYNLAEENKLITYAAGIWNGYTYTNCLEAFLENYEKECRAFEIDWMVTSDGVVVGRHDWSTVMYGSDMVAEEELKLDVSKRNNLPKTYAELLDMYEDRTPLTWTDMLDYLDADEKLYVVTDTKYTNETAVRYMFGKMVEEARKRKKENVLDRVVVQIYNQDMYQVVMDVYPFRSVIYTLYQSPDDNDAVLEFVENTDVRIITLPKGSRRDDDAFFRKLIEKGCYIYVHTVNDLDQAAEYMARGCSGIYTDAITPEMLPELEEKISEAKQRLAEEDASKEVADPELTAEELEANKEYLLNYLREIKGEEYLVLMSVQDEATAAVDDDIAEALTELGVSEDYRNAYRQSYIGVMSGGKKIYEAFSDEVLEHVYIEGEDVFRVKSTGNGLGAISGISVNGSKEETETLRRGLHITVFNKVLGSVQDRIVFDLYEGLGHTVY